MARVQEHRGSRRFAFLSGIASIKEAGAARRAKRKNETPGIEEIEWGVRIDTHLRYELQGSGKLQNHRAKAS